MAGFGHQAPLASTKTLRDEFLQKEALMLDRGVTFRAPPVLLA